MGDENRNLQAESGIGRSLEKARENKGFSLWQAEHETRIRSRYLRNLEREEFDVLPAVYVLGSLKTYADFLGLDGAELSRQLKARLVEPAESDASAQLAAFGDTRDDEYEADPAPAVGFDQLFFGMGVVLISILAVMTLVTAIAQGDESPVSQINEPSTPETPSGMALAGNVQDEPTSQPRREESTPNAEHDVGKGRTGKDVGSGGDENEEDRTEDEPEAPKNGEDGEDRGDKDDQSTPQATSVFDGVEFVPVSPSPPAASASAAPPSASPAPSSPAPSSPAPSSPAPATVRPDDSPASPAPAVTGASSKPAGDPVAAPTAPVASGGDAPSRPGGGEERATPPTSAADRISTEVDRKVSEAFGDAGLGR